MKVLAGLFIILVGVAVAGVVIAAYIVYIEHLVHWMNIGVSHAT